MENDRQQEIAECMLDQEEIWKISAKKELKEIGHTADECEKIVQDFQYILLFCRDYPDYDPINDTFFFPMAPTRYMYNRNKFIEGFTKITNDMSPIEKKVAKACKLKEDDFYHFDLLQDSIKKLGLAPQATFEFMAFLYHYVRQMNEDDIRCGEKLERMSEAVKNSGKEEKITMTITVGKDKFEFTNSYFLKEYLSLQHEDGSDYMNIVQYGEKGATPRGIQYLFIKNLLTYLPYTIKKDKGIKYTQLERDFSLCALHLCGFLRTDNEEEVEIICTRDNNATFDKLMRDFDGKNYKIRHWLLL
jgi:hypothetical protein